MLCHNCGGENRDDYKFCVHCGSAREPAAAQSFTPPPVRFQPEAQDDYSAGASQPASSKFSAFMKKKGVLPALIAVLVVLCLGALAIAGFVLCQAGVLPFCPGNDNRIVIAMPNRDGEAELYLLRLGQDIEKATLLAENAYRSDFYLSYMQGEMFYSLGGFGGFGGFIPEQSYLVFWYEDDDGDVHVLRQEFNQDTPDEIYDSSSSTTGGRLFNNFQDIYFYEDTGDEERCYISTNGEAAERITKNDDCYIVRSGAYLVSVERDGNETTLTLINSADGEEITILDAQEDVDGYRVSADGSRVAYLSTEDDPQIFLLDGETGEEIAQGESAYNILSYSFAYNTNRMIYIAENEDGELELYLLDDDGSLLVASSLYLYGSITTDGRYIIYLTGDEDGENVVYSYEVSTGESTEIVTADGLTYTLLRDDSRVLIAQQDDDDLTIYSSSIDGGDLITLYEENDSYLGNILYAADRSELFLVIESDNNNSIFFTPVDNNTGFFILEEYYGFDVLDLSPDGSKLLVSGREDSGDDPELFVLPLDPDETPIVLDDNQEEYPLGVFSADGRDVIYTARTGDRADDYEILQVVADGEEAPETLYEEAYLVDVQWTRIDRFENYYMNDTLEGSSYCPGAPTITLGETLDGSLVYGGENCYRFRATGGQPFTFEVEAGYDSILTLYDRDGYELERDDDSGSGNNPRLIYNPAEDGTYFIKIRAYSSGEGSYTISMIDGIGDEAFDNATPLAANELTRGYITSSTSLYLESYDYSTYGIMYSFEATSGQYITIDVIADSGGSEVDPMVYLFDWTTEVLESDDNSGSGNDSQISFSVYTDGTYYILVEDYYNEFGDSTNYWFDILLTR